MSYQNALTITQISEKIKDLLEMQIPSLWLEGEISNFKSHYSGHFYFVLKDEGAQINAVMWRSRTSGLSFEPADGMLVQALGNVTVYPKAGKYQFDIVQMYPAGQGFLQLEFNRLKEKLDREGLFDTAHKKPIPLYPQKIAVVTSSTGAALQDILQILKRRAPEIAVQVFSVQVQGEKAGDEIAAALQEINRRREADCIIAGRGGGSIEDLWAFNEEKVARAIFASKIPVISAVGHEIDFTVADFVADLRAATPSAAAEIVSQGFVQVRDRLRHLQQSLQYQVKALLAEKSSELRFLSGHRAFAKIQSDLRSLMMQTDMFAERLYTIQSEKIGEISHQLELYSEKLHNLNPLNILQRGYSITLKADGEVLRRREMAAAGEIIRTVLSDGELKSKILEQVNL